MKNNFLRCFVLLWLFFAAMALQAQDSEQAKLLKRAYRLHSKVKLEQFFEDWANEVEPNDTSATDPYVAEAFKLFPVFYQPTNTPGLEKGPYQDYPYYIVQSWLDEIRVTDEIQPPPYEEGHFNYTEGSTVVAEGIPFRPALAIEGKKIVYYTGFYGSLITNFIDAQRITMKDLDRKSIAFKICRSKMRFIHQMVYLRTRYAIYINEWITYPIVQDIIFDKTLQHAIVLFYVRDCKGHAFLEKIDGEWVKVETTLDWCMDD